MGSMVNIANWQGMQSPLGQGVEYGVNQVWLHQQANADKWATQAKANDDAWRTQHQKDVEAWSKQQEDWQTKWAYAQAAYALAQMALSERALDAAKDAAQKQYDIANRQQVIAESEYARYSTHFAPCENATIDEECARPEYTEDIEAQANRAAVDVRRQFALQRQQLQRQRSRYCIGASLAAERTLAVEEAKAIAEAKEKVRRFLEERQDARRDKFFNRKTTMFNVGRGIKADAVGQFDNVAAGIAKGTDLELAGRNQFYGAILSGLGGFMGAFMPSRVPLSAFASAQGMRTGAGVGGISSNFNPAMNVGGGLPISGMPDISNMA